MRPNRKNAADGDGRSLVLAGLALHRANRAAEAERLYRRALCEQPEDPEALGLLGTLLYSQLRYEESLELLCRANEATGWQARRLRHNLACAMGRLQEADLRPAQARHAEAFGRWRAAREVVGRPVSPLVSVLVPVYNHEHFVEAALRSVFAQSYRNVELVVIDDGSTDRSAEVARRALRDSPFPVTWQSRANRGAPATLNECAGLARGAYVNPLNSDDRFPPDRLERMVAEVAARGLDWGFARIRCIDGDGKALSMAHPKARELLQTSAGGLDACSASMAFLVANPMISTGNLFVRRDFLLGLGGVRDLRFNHDWEFGLRAGCFSEPWVVGETLYDYRLHGHNTITEGDGEPAKAEWEATAQEILSCLSSPGGKGPNPLGPFHAANRSLAIGVALSSGLGASLPVEVLAGLAQACRPRPPRPEGSAASAGGIVRRWEDEGVSGA